MRENSGVNKLPSKVILNKWDWLERQKSKGTRRKGLGIGEVDAGILHGGGGELGEVNLLAAVRVAEVEDLEADLRLVRVEAEQPVHVRRAPRHRERPIVVGELLKRSSSSVSCVRVGLKRERT